MIYLQLKKEGWECAIVWNKKWPTKEYEKNYEIKILEYENTI